MLLELLTGKLVTPTEAMDTYALSDSGKNAAPLLARVDAVWPSAAAASLAALVLHCISHKDKRPASMIVVIQRLKELRDIVAPDKVGEKRECCLMCAEDTLENNGVFCSGAAASASAGAGATSAGAGAAATGERHFTCTPCLSRTLLLHAEPARVRDIAFIDGEAQIPCEFCKAATVTADGRTRYDEASCWRLAQLAQHLDKATLARFVTAGLDSAQQLLRGRQYAEDAEAARLAEANEANDVSAGFDEQVRRHRLLITNQCFTNCCPRCKRAYDKEPETCNAVTCGVTITTKRSTRSSARELKGICGCHFCALCLEVCNTDMETHQHIAKAHKSGLFDRALLVTMRLQRHTKAVAAALSAIAVADMRSAVKAAVADDMRGAGVDPLEVQAAVDASTAAASDWGSGSSGTLVGAGSTAVGSHTPSEAALLRPDSTGLEEHVNGTSTAPHHVCINCSGCIPRYAPVWSSRKQQRRRSRLGCARVAPG